jgi:hypothetical protein
MKHEVELFIPAEESENQLFILGQVALKLNIAGAEIAEIVLVKRSIDARRKPIMFLLKYDVYVGEKPILNFDSIIEKLPDVHEAKRVIVVGAGPAGLFAALRLIELGLKPIIFERGEDIEARLESVKNFFKNGKLNSESNIQFGEGGAGTFSDGKLYTLINDPRSSFIFSELIEAGAPAEIAYSATPHIGTDKLRDVIKNIRKKIITHGGEFHFNKCLTDLEIKDKKIIAAVFNNQERILVDDLILAIGHSARDTYKMLYNNKLKIIPKAYAIGLRIEHKAKTINKAQYGNVYNHKKLGTARYKLVEHPVGERSVYTFCMCPGGYVMGAASEEGGLVTNGMSEYLQDGKNSNSALLVPILTTDFSSGHPLAGVDFQRFWERKAFMAGGANYQAPAQLVGDFLAGRASEKIGKVEATYRPGIKLTSLENCLPDYVISSIKKALPLMAKKIKGFADSDALLTGVETRTSSPLRFLRNELCESNILGIYPAGEGAGYAGGIVSSAIDGLVVAEAIIKKIDLEF